MRGRGPRFRGGAAAQRGGEGADSPPQHLLERARRPVDRAVRLVQLRARERVSSTRQRRESGARRRTVSLVCSSVSLCPRKSRKMPVPRSSVSSATRWLSSSRRCPSASLSVAERRRCAWANDGEPERESISSATWSARGAVDEDERRASRSALVARAFCRAGRARSGQDARVERGRNKSTHNLALVPRQRRPMIPKLALELGLVIFVGRLRLELHLLNLRAGALGQSGRAARGGEREHAQSRPPPRARGRADSEDSCGHLRGIQGQL